MPNVYLYIIDKTFFSNTPQVINKVLDVLVQALPHLDELDIDLDWKNWTEDQINR